MAKVLISIISENLVANMLFFKMKIQQFEEQYFIVTDEMKRKSMDSNLEKAMNILDGVAKRILVPNDSYADVINELEKAQLPQENEYWINQTGGTKPMSIAVFQFFQQYNAKFVYLPIGGKEFLDLKDKNVTFPIQTSLSLEEYLTLYGIRFESNETHINGKEIANNLFSDLARRNWNLPDNLRNADQFYKDPFDKFYFKGAWFEEYVYHRIKDELKLENGQIAVSAKLYRGDNLVNDNEIDVMFLKENILHIVECKVSMYGARLAGWGRESDKDTITDYLYKLAAISKDLGLRVNSYIFTLHPMQKLSTACLRGIENRAKILGIKGIYDGRMLCGKTLFSGSVKESFPTKQQKVLVSAEKKKSSNKKEVAAQSHNNQSLPIDKADENEPQKEHVAISLPRPKVIGKIDLSGLDRSQIRKTSFVQKYDNQ